jgi:hypothetical protein
MKVCEMPREKIVHNKFRMFDTEVSWSRDSNYVEIGTTIPDYKTFDEMNLGEYDGIWNELDLQELNKLIRVLKKARRQAFLEG